MQRFFLHVLTAFDVCIYLVATCTYLVATSIEGRYAEFSQHSCTLALDSTNDIIIYYSNKEGLGCSTTMVLMYLQRKLYSKK